MSAPVNNQATGYAVKDPKHYLDFEVTKYELEPLEDDRVTVAVECCGVCGSDHHTISGGWGPWETKFVVTGHEVVGKVVEVGKNVTQFKVGQRVGVGAQVGSCGECKWCKRDNGEFLSIHAATDRRRELLPRARPRLQHQVARRTRPPGRLLDPHPRPGALRLPHP